MRSYSADEASRDAPVLVADLDGTLCRTDTLHEAILRLASASPLTLLRLPVWVLTGRAGFKARIADHSIVPGSDLPLNQIVIDRLADASRQGWRTALVSAADQRQVDAVAETAGLFDEVHGSTPDHNLKGRNKARFLIDRYGEKGFDYIGDHRADLPIWAVANRALTVRANPALRRAAAEANADVDHLDPPTGQARAFFAVIWPRQWARNLLLFLPMLIAGEMSGLAPVLLGFLAFCLATSAMGSVNDLLDLVPDRAHPDRRKRPLAAGEVSALSGVMLAALPLVASLVLAVLMGNPGALAALVAYLVLATGHAMGLRRITWVHLLTFAGLDMLRFLAGSALAGVALPPWLLGVLALLCLGLAAITGLRAR